MKTLDMIKDLDDIVKPFENEEISAENGNLAVTNAAQKIASVQDFLKNELEMNKIASRESLGWAVVKELETDPLFQDDEDGAKTKNLKDAGKRAAKSQLQKRSLRGRGSQSRERRPGRVQRSAGRLCLQVQQAARELHWRAAAAVRHGRGGGTSRQAVLPAAAAEPPGQRSIVLEVSFSSSLIFSFNAYAFLF